MRSWLQILDLRGLGLAGRATVFAGFAIVVLDELGTFRDPVVTRGPVFVALGAVCAVGALATQGGGRGVWRRTVLGVPLLAPVVVRASLLFAALTALLLLRDVGRGATDVAWGLAGAGLGLRSAATVSVTGADPLGRVLPPLALMGAVAVLLPERSWLVLGPLVVAAWALAGFGAVWRRHGALVFEVGRSDGR